jgi:hypothetical protein
MDYLAAFCLEPHKSKSAKPGDRFGRLTVLAIGKPKGTYRYAAVCSCDCGSKPLRVRLDALRKGVTESCGCIQAERTTTHGLTKSPLYNCWNHMVSRCTKPSNGAFRHDGGRGIRVCERWLSVENFVADMAPTFRKGLELDRINNDGDYCPENCRWTTRSENCDNRRSGVRITFRGKTKSIRRWSEETGISYGTLWERLQVWKWEPERALTTPPLDDSERMQIARDARWG